MQGRGLGVPGKAAEALVQALGARGYEETNHAPRILRDARSFLVSEGPTETLVMYIGSRVLNAGADLERFISAGLNAPRVARRLREAAEEIRERVSKGHLAGRIGEENERYWSAWRVGEIAVRAILAAAAEGAPDRVSGSAASWALLEFEARAKAILDDRSEEWALGRGEEARDRIAEFAEAIGEVEQVVSGVASEPDPLLRRARADTRRDTDAAELEWDAGPGGDAASEAPARLLAALGAIVARHTLDETVTLRLDDGPHGVFDVELDLSSGVRLSDVVAQAAKALELPSASDRDPVVLLRTTRATSESDARESAALTVEMRTEDGRRTSWKYQGPRLGSASAPELAARLQELVRSSVESPGEPVDRLALLRREEGEALVERWNQTAAEYPRDLSVHALVQRQAVLTPEKPAVVSDAGTMTYVELDARADRLARRLRRMGIANGARVGLCVGRSRDLPVAILAILKTGAAYVPLDTSQPPARLARMLEEMRFGAIVAAESMAALLPAHGAAVISPERDDAASGDGQDARLEAVPAEEPAYVLYTSGSTGVPKAVEVSHRSVVNLLTSMRSRPGFSDTDVLVAVTNISFDIAALELFLPLVSGGLLVLANARTALDGVALSRLIEENHATVLQGTPATWQMLLASGWTGSRGLKALCGGETLPAELAARIRACTGSLWNMYGPTETTIWSCVEEVTGDGPISIGRPIANTRVYILDNAFHPVPPGVPGEIFIAGDGVARGYWKRDGLTSERFLADPFGGPVGGRMYRTGDVGRFDPEGRIMHLGRRDRQVKVRGHRVELGEIETAIERHPAVRDAVVESLDYGHADTRLIAAVLLQPGASEAGLPLRLRTHTQGRVPAYMVPASFVVLEKFPMTPNGKLDRAALRVAAEERLAEASRSVALVRDEAFPGKGTTLERAIAEIWSALLKVTHVGADDDFFALGGHSLLATQVVSRIRASFGVEIPVEAIFERPTLAALVSAVESASAQGRRGGREQAVELDSHPATIELSSIQQRFWFLDKLQPGTSQYNVPFALRLKGELDREALRLAIEDLTLRQETLRTRIGERDAYPFQHFAPPGPWALQVVDLTELPENERDAERDRIIQAEAQLPFDLGGESLFRTTLLRCSPRDHVLVVSMHHIITDGWSVEVLLRDLAALYGARRSGQESPLAPLPMRYADFALSEKKWLQTSSYQEHLAYWQESLANLPSLDLPADRARPASPSFRGGYLGFALSADLTASLHRLARRQRASLFMVLMAGWQALLSRYSDQDDFAIGLAIANRTEPGFEDVAGCFLNTLVLRADLSGDPTFAELLSRVRERALKAYAHQAVPFDRLVQELVVRRDSTRNPIYQVMLNMQNAPASGALFPGLESELIRVRTPTSKLELDLIAREREGQLSGEWEYSAELFDAATIQRMATHFETLLEAAAADPDQPVAELPLASADSRDEVLATKQGDPLRKP